jgi:hypothetical protein
MKSISIIFLWSYLICSCASTRSTSRVQSMPQVLYTDFCKLRGVQVDITESQIWSAQSVQYHLQQLIAQSKIVNTPWVAYPSAYLKMTAARDESRCAGVLRSDDAFNARVNDLLSDLMSRFYMIQVDLCASSDATLGQGNGFCPLMARMKKEKFDSLSAAMSSTGVYISSHITLALVAIIFADDFWQASPYPETYRKSAEWSAVLSARIEKIRRYKPLFDKFNGFLADNIKTVAKALSDAKLLKGDVLYFLSGVGQYVPFKALAFGKIRDDAFSLALELATEINPADHPMMVGRSGWNRINYGYPNIAFQFPKKLAMLENEAIEFTANPAFMLMYRSVLGGKSWEEVMRSGKN